MPEEYPFTVGRLEVSLSVMIRSRSLGLGNAARWREGSEFSY